jgi:hypothetical protein
MNIGQQIKLNVVVLILLKPLTTRYIQLTIFVCFDIKLIPLDTWGYKYRMPGYLKLLKTKLFGQSSHLKIKLFVFENQFEFNWLSGNWTIFLSKPKNFSSVQSLESWLWNQMAYNQTIEQSDKFSPHPYQTNPYQTCLVFKHLH